MRLPGICSECHRPRQVSVSGHALALARISVVSGICSECEERAGSPFAIVDRSHGATVLPRHRSLRAAVHAAAGLVARRGYKRDDLEIREHGSHHPFPVVRHYDPDGRVVPPNRRRSP